MVSDALPCSWTDQARQTAFLNNILQAPVGHGMTPLQQPTDTHLAKPAKDCARSWQETVREACRLSAQRLGEPVSYDCGPRQLVSIAVAMHDEMVRQNTQSDSLSLAVSKQSAPFKYVQYVHTQSRHQTASPNPPPKSWD